MKFILFFFFPLYGNEKLFSSTKIQEKEGGRDTIVKFYFSKSEKYMDWRKSCGPFFQSTVSSWLLIFQIFLDAFTHGILAINITEFATVFRIKATQCPFLPLSPLSLSRFIRISSDSIPLRNKISIVVFLLHLTDSRSNHNLFSKKQIIMAYVRKSSVKFASRERERRNYFSKLSSHLPTFSLAK